MTSRDGDEERVVDHVNKRARTSATSERVENSIGLPFVAFLFLNLFSTFRSLTTHTSQPTRVNRLASSVRHPLLCVRSYVAITFVFSTKKKKKKKKWKKKKCFR
jgi:hypothetical protein